MEYSHPQLMQGGTLKEVAESILEAGSAFSRVPVVDSESNLLYDLKLSNLKDYFRACALEHSKDISEAEQEKIKNYIGFLTSNSYSSVLDDSYQSMVMAQGESEEVKVLLCKMIDFSSHFLLGEDSPFAVNESTPLAKVHFLFIMLGFNQVYVVRKGQLVGMISRESFSKTRTN
jgi:CBS domain-containing protein